MIRPRGSIAAASGACSGGYMTSAPQPMHGDGRPAGRHRASVRRRIDAPREAAHDRKAARREIRGEPLGDVERVRRRRARADDRDGVTRQRRARPARPEHRRRIDDRGERRRILRRRSRPSARGRVGRRGRSPPRRARRDRFACRAGPAIDPPARRRAPRLADRRLAAVGRHRARHEWEAETARQTSGRSWTRLPRDARPRKRPPPPLKWTRGSTFCRRL